MSPKNKAYLQQREQAQFRRGALEGFGPEVAAEDIVRATMVVRLNSMTYAAISPQVTHMLVELLNRRVTPVIRSRGSVGEAALSQMDNIKGTKVGAGDACLNDVRIIQDPESLRASSTRQGSAWAAWAALRDAATLQINSSDNNPAVAEGSPADSWELRTPMMMRYYVKGGKLSGGKHGFIYSNAN